MAALCCARGTSERVADGNRGNEPQLRGARGGIVCGGAAGDGRSPGGGDGRSLQERVTDRSPLRRRHVTARSFLYLFRVMEGAMYTPRQTCVTKDV